jgi:alpha-tubulin suppressor-like RCC1 family protein
MPPAVQVSVASMHACALTVDGSVWCWGNGFAFNPFEFGTCDPHPCGGGPSRLLGVPPALQVAAGTAGTCALLRDGALFCWGPQVNGLRSRSADDPRRPILPPGRAVSATIQTNPTFCALGLDQRVRCWGQLNIPVRGIFGSTFPAIEVPQAAGAQMLSVGSLNTCAIGLQGAVLCWGANGDGQLGLGHTSADVFRPALVRFSD